MTQARRLILLVLAFFLSFATLADLAAQQEARLETRQVPPELLKELRWRMIGPFRGGRTKAATGVASQPNTFYIGACNGGVWKTTDAGRTWVPIFDDQPTGSIGAIAVAPSAPTTIYVGSGEGLQRPDLSTGDGIYKSSDAGATWTHLGLRDGQQIPQIIVDPRDPQRLFVAVLGHPYGPNEERGIFRSTDGGATFKKVLYKDENTGGVDLAFDSRNPDIVYAVLWETRLAPWENGQFNGPGSGLYKSTDGGDTWRQLTKGLPTYADGLGRIGITVAPSNPTRLYATVEAGGGGWVYRSDDAGESWAMTSDDPRPAGRPDDFAEIKADPTNPDIVYSASVVTWKSTDGGKTWTGFRGAPGGDDYHRIWINPNDPQIMLLAVDQGAIVTVNGGQSWSSWYNQPTAQMFHVNADNAFPYRVCGGQQESGSACVQSRGDDGQITFREWHPAAVEEYAYAVPDPLDPDIVYGGKVTRWDRRTGQVQNVGPTPIPGENSRAIRTAPLVFSTIDQRILYFGTNVVWKTSTGGQSWAAISPDLSRATWEVPRNVGKYIGSEGATSSQRGVVYTIAPSPIEASRIWAGTDDGLIHLTTSGGSRWRDVTPPDIRPWAKVSIIEASHFDPQEAFAAVNTFRLDDLRPHIYRTYDSGKTWEHITRGIPDGAAVNVVREDTKRPGLLFAGTEQSVYVSFNDGGNWQPLRLNMPATSIRDLIVKDDDLVVATHGRGFWILDNITPLREFDPKLIDSPAYLFTPQDAWRFRWNKNTDTPLPPDEPAGQNPPDGAILDYYLRAEAQGGVSLDIFDASKKLVRRFTSEDAPEPLVEGRNIPDYWIRPSRIMSAKAGLHRFVWDLHYPPPAVTEFGYPIAAIFQNTPRVPAGPWVPPGTYTVKFTANGKTQTQTLVVKMDPRVKTTASGLQQQFTLSMQIYDALDKTAASLKEVAVLAAQLNELRGKAPEGPMKDAVAVLARKVALVETGGVSGRVKGKNQVTEPGYTMLRGQFASLFDMLQEGDLAPTPQMADAVDEVQKAFSRVNSTWKDVKSRDVATLNKQLKKVGLQVAGVK
jgi:photosystem II stability/assembly factor-like uncharacterized protein